MAKAVKIKASARTKTLSQMRQDGAIPAVLYGHGISNENVEVNAREFEHVFKDAGYTTLVTVAIGDKDHNVLIRDVQFHPMKDAVTHIDFYQVRMDEKVRANVPVSFVGESAAVKDMSGVLVKNIDEIDLEALPQNLPRDIEVDISVLTDFEKVIKVGDLKVPEGVELFHEADEVIALVQPPRTDKELESLSEETTEDVSAVEVVKDKEKEGAEEGEEGAEGEATEEKKA